MLNFVALGKAERTIVEPALGHQSQEILAKAPSVLFVCKANAWRSPVAEAVMKKVVDQHPVSGRLRIDSAGVCDDMTGKRAAWSLRWCAFLRGYRITSRSRRILRTDLMRFDMVVAMDQSILNEVKSLHSHPTSKLCLLSDFLGPEWPHEVPDPAVIGVSCLKLVFDMVEAACPKILDCLFIHQVAGKVTAAHAGAS
mgnify:CR=1 FL=1